MHSTLPSLRPLFLAVISVLALSAARPVLGQAGAIASGVTEPFQDVVLSAPVAGAISKRLVKEGDEVMPGQVLIEMEKRQEELEVERRKLAMDSKAEVNAAKARVATVKADVDSTRKLFEATKAVSKDDLAKKELELQLSLAEVERLDMTEAKEVVEYQMAQELLKQRVVRAPFAGHVVELLRDVGEECKAQEPLLRVVDPRQFYFVANVEARLGHSTKVGQPMTVEVEAGTAKVQVSGKVSFVSSVVDPASGLLKIKVLCPNADEKIKPGVAGTMRLSP